MKIQNIHKTVWLLEKASDEVEIGVDGEYEDYTVFYDMTILKGEFDLISNHKEQDIRGELEAVFSRKFPSITRHDFEFVKRNRNVISTPVVKEGHQWDFGHVKHLSGNGRLYVRLVTDGEEIEPKSATSEGLPSNTPTPSSTPTSNATVTNVSNTASALDAPLTVDNDGHDDDDADQPLPESGASQSIPTVEQRVASVAAVFPGIPLAVIRRALSTHGSTEEAVNTLLNYRSSEGEREPGGNATDTGEGQKE